MKITHLSILFFSMAAALCCVPSAHADHKIVETVTVTVAPEQIPRNTGTVTTWIGEEHLVRVDELNQVTTIIRRDTQPQQMLIVLHERQEVLELELPLEIPEHLVPAFAELKMDWNINRRTDEQQIGDWNCRRFQITGRGPMRVEMELWATVDTTINTRRFHDMLGESFSATPIFRDMADLLYSISPYFAIRTTTTIEQLGLRTVTESTVDSITDEATPAEILAPPADYERRALDFSIYLSLIRKTRPNTEY